MKHLMIAVFFLILVACGKTSDHAGHQDGDNDGENPNKALYDQVMSIHDEVMPKMEDIYKLKKQLLEELTKSNLMADKRKEIEGMVSKLDSTNNAMMDWMHNFNEPDTTDQEAAREYLETQMEQIKKVRDLTNETLVKAKAVVEKK